MTYAKGLGAHAASDVRVTIPAGCTTFKAVIGVDDEVGANGSVSFQVFGDSTQPVHQRHHARGRSPARRSASTSPAAASCGWWWPAAATSITYDHADWANARFQCAAGSNVPPTANAAATPTSGTAPLTVNFSATGSTDPNGDALTYAWDLDGDGAFDDSTSATPSFTYPTPTTVTVGLRATDPGGLSDTDTVVITVSPLARPSTSPTWPSSAPPTAGARSSVTAATASRERPTASRSPSTG